MNQMATQVTSSDDAADSGADTGADIIARHLAAAGCRHVFGMPGGEVVVLLDALERHGLRFTLCKHENAAGFMAEGSWHATGAPAVMLTTVGPGLANGINSIANALQEQVPMIVLSGCIDASEAERFTHQVLDQSRLMEAVTKAQLRVAPGTAAHVIQKAIAAATMDPPGPVHVDLPVGLAAQAATDTAISPPVAARPGWPDEQTLRDAADRLNKADRPLVIAGLGAMHHHADKALSDLCRANGIPCLTTYKAKGLMPENDPLSLRGHGLSPKSDAIIMPLLDAADCILLAGYDPIEMRAGWIDPWQAGKVVELCHADLQHGMHGSALKVVGDIARLLDQLRGALNDRGDEGRWPDGAPRAARAALDAAFSAPDRWGPHKIFEVIAREAAPDTVFTADSGAHRILMTQMLRCGFPRQLLQSSALCTMGVAVPLAAGFARARDGASVIAVVGDAGFDMCAGELATIRDAGLKMTIVVPVDGSLALIEKKQAGMQLPKRGVSFGNTDFVGVAQAYGGQGHLVRDERELVKAMGKANEFNGFSVIACEIDNEDYAMAF